MNSISKKPVLWRMLLKKAAVLALVFLIVYLLLNYIASAFYEVAYTDAVKTDMDNLVNVNPALNVTTTD